MGPYDGCFRKVITTINGLMGKWGEIIAGIVVPLISGFWAHQEVVSTQVPNSQSYPLEITRMASGSAAICCCSVLSG